MRSDEKVNILLVDDQPGKLLSYEIILAELGENLIKASSAKEALQHLLKTDVAVVLVDACMPEMDGFELAEMIRKHPRCDNTSIILVSAIYLSDFDRLRGYGAGAVDYVPVPIVPELLRAKVSIFADLFRKTQQLSRLNSELERRVEERTAALEASTARLRASEAKFRRTFECNMVPMGEWTREGLIAEANDALLRLLGYDREDLHAGRIRWRGHASGKNGDGEGEGDSDELFWSEIISHGVGPPHERSLTDKQGRSIPILFGGASFDADAERGVFFAVDLSDRKRADEDRTRLLESEREARGAAEEANRLKDEFLATLSHELRTPINAVLGWVQLMNRGSLDADSTQEGLRAIDRGVRTQVRLIDELLDVNRVESGKFRISEDTIDLAAVLTSAIDTIAPEANEKGIALIRRGDFGALMLRGDGTKLQQVFWNLLSNATKFTPAGGRIEIQVEHRGTSVRVVVSDTGQGIRRDFLPKVFDRFRQGDSSITRKHGGLGLGLAIAKCIVQMHGGTIEAHSDGEQRGARFVVSLPVRTTPLGPMPTETPRATVGADLAGIRVLIVDDDASTRDIVSRTLREDGAATRVAEGADEAMAVLESWLPDVMVCDLGMPVKDGYAMMREMRALPHVANIPAIALTAYTRPDDRARALAVGYNVHLAKPVNPLELAEAVFKLAPSKLPSALQT
jgi:PAS domain S-box-containing protein